MHAELIMNRTVLASLLGAVLSPLLAPAAAAGAGFEDQPAMSRLSEASVGDIPAESAPRRALESEAMAVATVPVGAPTAERVTSAEFPAEDAAVVTITDFAPDSSCGPGCACARCCAQGAVGDSLIQRIRELSPGLTTTLRAEAILLWRGPPAGRPLFTSYTYDPVTPTIGPTVFDAKQMASDPVAAPRVAVERMDECGRGVEAAFLYAGNFYASHDLPFVSNGYAFAPPGIYGNTWGVNNTPLSAAQSSLIANLCSAEVNLRSPRGYGATRFLAGFRWLQWGENWKMTDQFSDPLDPTVTGVDSYRTNCINNLYGGQIGLDTLLWNRGEGFRVESIVKAGAYYNAAAESSAYDYTTNTGFSFSRQVSVGGPAAGSFVGEIGLTAVVPVRRNLDLRLGYFGLWLEGIAQPLNQLSSQTLTQIDAPSGTLNTKGTVVVQGLSLGLEGRW